MNKDVVQKNFLQKLSVNLEIGKGCNSIWKISQLSLVHYYTDKLYFCSICNWLTFQRDLLVRNGYHPTVKSYKMQLMVSVEHTKKQRSKVMQLGKKWLEDKPDLNSI